MKQAQQLGEPEGRRYLSEQGFDLTISEDGTWKTVCNDPELNKQREATLSEVSDLLNVAQQMGKNEGERFLSGQGFQLTIEEDGAWTVDNGKHIYSAEAPSNGIPSQLRGFLRGISMIAEVGGLAEPGENWFQPRFRVNRSFGGALPCNDEEWEPSNDEIEKMRTDAINWPEDIVAVGTWVRYENDLSMILAFSECYEAFPYSAYIYANVAMWHCSHPAGHESAIWIAASAVFLLDMEGASPETVADFCYNAAFLLSLSGERGGINLLQKVFESDEGNGKPLLHVVYAEILFMHDDEGAAGEREKHRQIDLAIESGGQCPLVLGRCAAILALDGISERAMEYAKCSMRLAKTTEEIYVANYAMGVSLLNCGLLEESIDYFSQVLDMSNGIAKLGLAQAYVHVGKKKEAVAFAKEYLAINSEHELCLRIVQGGDLPRPERHE